MIKRTKPQTKTSHHKLLLKDGETTDTSLIAAVYFGLFVMVFNWVAKYLLFVLKSNILLPFFSSTLLALVLGGFFGGLFGKRLTLCQKGSHTFAYGMLLAVVITPFYSLGLQIIYYLHNHTLYTNIHHWQDYLVLYGVILLFFILVAGIWLIPLTGVAALLFNQRFLPGWYTYRESQEKKSIRPQSHAKSRD